MIRVTILLENKSSSQTQIVYKRHQVFLQDFPFNLLFILTSQALWGLLERKIPSNPPGFHGTGSRFQQNAHFHGCRLESQSPVLELVQALGCTNVPHRGLLALGNQGMFPAPLSPQHHNFPLHNIHHLSQLAACRNNTYQS